LDIIQVHSHHSPPLSGIISLNISIYGSCIKEAFEKQIMTEEMGAKWQLEHSPEAWNAEHIFYGPEMIK